MWVKPLLTKIGIRNFVYNLKMTQYKKEGAIVNEGKWASPVFNKFILGRLINL